MKTSDFDYNLPEELIAEYPLESRSASRLLIFNNEIEHKFFKDILDYFDEGDLLVLNHTSVIPARIFGKKDSGGVVEVMLERFMENNKALVQIKSGKRFISSLGWSVTFLSIGLIFGGLFETNSFIQEISSNSLSIQKIKSLPAMIILWIGVIFL